MATRQILDGLARAYTDRTGQPVGITSIGGVDAARRVAAGEAFDCVVLAGPAIDALRAAGHVVDDSVVPLLRSGMAVAVRHGTPHPPLATEADLKAAVLAAQRIGYSTGPSGTHLLQLFERWGIADLAGPRAIQAPPGTPVAQLIARGDDDLGFQQASELTGIDGVDVVGPLPAAVQAETVFTGAVCTASRQPQAARDLLAFLGSAAAEPYAVRFGMIRSQ